MELKSLHIALDLARFLADDKRLNNSLSDDEKRLALNIAKQIKNTIESAKAEGIH
jgi:hypothetical protein